MNILALAVFSIPVLAGTIATASMDGQQCSQSAQCAISEFDGYGHSASVSATATAGNFSVSAYAGAGGSVGYQSVADADAVFSQKINLQGSGIAEFTFFVNVAYIYSDYAPASSLTCFFDQCVAASNGVAPAFGSGPTTYSIDVLFNGPIDFRIESAAHFAGFNDPGGWARSIITLQSVSILTPEPNPFVMLLVGLCLILGVRRVPLRPAKIRETSACRFQGGRN